MRTRATRWVALAMALALAGCVEQTNGSLLISFVFPSRDVTADRLSVQVLDDGLNDIVPVQDKPTPDGGLLGPGDTLRIYFNPERAGQTVSLFVLASSPAQPPYLPEGLVVAAAQVPFVIPSINRELALDVALIAIGNIDCPADVAQSGCCTPDPQNPKRYVGGGPQTSMRTANTNVPPCGADRKLCTFCNFFTADNCASGTCRCGTGPACGADQLCNQGQCGCSALNCFGCCQGNRCIAPAARSAEACGGGAAQCDICSSPATCNGSSCEGAPQDCALGLCRSGNRCQPQEHPRCRGENGADCETCDSYRSDRCKPGGGCACGMSGNACGPGQFCDRGAMNTGVCRVAPAP